MDEINRRDKHVVARLPLFSDAGSIPAASTNLSSSPSGVTAMKSVFLLWHAHEYPDGSSSPKLIGVYASRADAEAAIARVGSQPGFAENPDGFVIDEYEIGQDHWSEGYFHDA